MRTLALLIFATGLMYAQAPQGKGKQAPQPPLMECGAHGDTEVLCGTRSPEDLEVTPDGKFLIVPQFVNGRGGPGGIGLTLFDIAAKTYAKMPVTVEPRKDWGDASCPGTIGDMLTPHGISLAKRSGGAMELYVVNHGGRQSMEMFELKPSGGSWTLVWHGCVPAMLDYNDVAALPDGGYIATHPTALRGADMTGKEATGFVSRWAAGKGETELPGTRAGYPNGVLVSSDGRYMYFNAWTAKEVHKYDLKANKEVGVVKLDFMPDNITWTDKKQMLAAGVKGTQGDCPAGSGSPCIQGFGVAEIDPAKMTAKTVFDSQGKGALIGGVSVALQVGNSMYVGSFQGDRLVKIPFKK